MKISLKREGVFEKCFDMFSYIYIYIFSRERWNSMRIMKNLIGKMVWINETGIIRIGKMFEYIKLDIYIYSDAKNEIQCE